MTDLPYERHGEESQEALRRFAVSMVEETRGPLGAADGTDLALRATYACWAIVSEKAPRLGKPGAVISMLADGRMLLSHAEPQLPHADPGFMAGAWSGAAREMHDQMATRLFVRLRTFMHGASVHPTEGLVLVYEEILRNRYRRFEGFRLPWTLANLMTALVVREDDEVLDPFCGDGESLLAAHRLGAASLAGWSPNQADVQQALRRLTMHGIKNARIATGDWLDEDEPSENTVIVGAPPFAMRHQGRLPIRVERVLSQSTAPLRVSATNALDIGWPLSVVEALRPGGRAVLLRSSSSLHQTGQREAVSGLVARGCVEAIIALPQGALAPVMQIDTVIWLLRPEQVNPGPVLMMTAQAIEPGLRSQSPRALDNEAVINTIRALRHNEELPVPGHVAKRIPWQDLLQARHWHPKAHLDEPPIDEVTHPAPERSKLTAIELSGFKAFNAHTRVPLAPLTLIYGANSAGKSSIVQALHLLAQSASSPTLIAQGSYRDLGTFDGLLHRRATDRLTIGIEYGVLPSWLPDAGTINPSLLRRLQWTWARSQGVTGELKGLSLEAGTFLVNLSVETDERNLSTLQLPLDQAEDAQTRALDDDFLYPPPPRATNPQNRRSNARRTIRAFENAGFDHIGFGPPSTLPTDCALSTTLPDIGRPQDTNIAHGAARKLTQALAGVSAEATALLRSLVWLGPLRSEPKRFYNRQQVNQASGDGSDAAFRLFDAPALTDEVNTWLERLEIPYRMKVLPASNPATAPLVGDLITVALTDRRTDTTVTPADVGFGISQSLPILVELLGQRDCIIAIEQPETHLHPRLQAHLADLFLDTVQPERQNNQVIVETHSEHLMLRIQRRIREEELDPDLVCVLYVDQQPGEGATVQRLRLNTDGQFIDEWPHGFFDERLDELF